MTIDDCTSLFYAIPISSHECRWTSLPRDTAKYVIDNAESIKTWIDENAKSFFIEALLASPGSVHLVVQFDAQTMKTSYPVACREKVEAESYCEQHSSSTKLLGAYDCATVVRVCDGQ